MRTIQARRVGVSTTPVCSYCSRYYHTDGAFRCKDTLTDIDDYIADQVGAPDDCPLKDGPVMIEWCPRPTEEDQDKIASKKTNGKENIKKHRIPPYFS